MKNKSHLLICFCLVWNSSLFAQCPDKNVLWNRLIFLRDSSTSTPAEQLKELLPIENIVKSCSFRIDSTHAFLLQRIGSEYYKQGEYSKSVQYYLQAINLISANAMKPSINLIYNINYYYGLSTVYTTLNKITEKIKAIDSCVAISIRTNAINILSLSAMYKKIEYLFYIGDYKNCIEYTKMCETLTNVYARKGKSEYEISTGYILSSLGWRIISLLELKDFATAREILIRKINEIKKTGDKTYLGTYIEKLAEVEISEGNFDQALLYFNQSLAYEQSVGHIIACKGILSNIGYNIYFNHLHDFRKAISYYRKSLSYSKVGSKQDFDAYETLNQLDNIANAYSHMGFFDSAMVYFQLAFDQIRPGINESILLDSLEAYMQRKKNHYLTDLLINKGDAYMRHYQDTKQTDAISKALLIYKTADLILDRIKEELTEVESKLFWRSNSRRLYEHAVDATYFENDPRSAFYFFEKSRSVLLNDQLNQLGKLSNEEIFELAQVKRKTLRLQREINKMDTSSVQSRNLQPELFANNQELDRLEQIIRHNSPLYYQSILDTGFIGLKEIQKGLLKDHHALLEIFAGDSSDYSLFMTKQNIYFNKINKADFDSTTGSYISYLSDPVLLNSHYDSYIKTANHLYRLVFKNNPVPDGRIIISPDGKIFPFEALITNLNGSNPVYFVNNHSVSYTYSARYLLTRFTADTSDRPISFLGVAPVKYTSNNSLANLEGSDESLAKIETGFSNSQNLLNADASKSNFQRLFSNFSIIQLYTHAADTSNQSEPVIYFADSALYLSDLIPENKPQTRLIVLSACETGNGKLNQGEGIFSFNRGFASIGIPSSIANLWSVDNKSTYQITELFYKYLADGLPIDVALQKAKLEFIQEGSKQNKLPYYWAAAILAGKSDAIKGNKTFPWKDIAIVFSLLALTFFVRQKQGKSRI